MSVHNYISTTRLRQCDSKEERNALINNARKADGWQVRWRVEGVKQSKTFLKKNGYTKRDAEQFDLLKKKEIDDGVINLASSAVPFTQLCERYKSRLIDQQARGELSERTVKWQTWHVDVMLQYPKFKRVKMKDFRNAYYISFREWLTSKDGKDYSISSATKLITTFKEVCRYGREIELTNFIPDDTNIRRRRNATALQAVSKKDIPQPSEVNHIIEHADGVMKSVLITLAETGMRIGECLALEWRHIDLNNRLIYVEQNLDMSAKIKRSVKTQSGERSIPIKDSLYAMLKQWKESASNKLVFPSTKGTPIDPTNLWRPHNKLLRDLGYVVDGKAKYSFHSYRHTYASAMLYSGLPNHVVANYMGHANGAITETLYAHVLKEVRNTKQAIEHSDNVVMLKGA